MENTNYERIITFWKEFIVPKALKRAIKVNLDRYCLVKE